MDNYVISRLIEVEGRTFRSIKRSKLEVHNKFSV